MTAKECIEKFNAKLLAELNCKASTKYRSRYDVDGNVDLNGENLTKLPITFGVITRHFDCSNNRLTTLIGAPIEVGWDFWCISNQLTTLDHLPKYIGGSLFCHDNPLQNVNALKNVEIKSSIWVSHKTEKQLDYWIRALFNTDLDVLEWHYDNHEYYFWNNKELERYIMNELEEIIKLKSLKRDMNLL